jgi:hypothetical protein
MNCRLLALVHYRPSTWSSPGKATISQLKTQNTRRTEHETHSRQLQSLATLPYSLRSSCFCDNCTCYLAVSLVCVSVGVFCVPGCVRYLLNNERQNQAGINVNSHRVWL